MSFLLFLCSINVEFWAKKTHQSFCIKKKHNHRDSAQQHWEARRWNTTLCYILEQELIMSASVMWHSATSSQILHVILFIWLLLFNFILSYKRWVWRTHPSPWNVLTKQDSSGVGHNARVSSLLQQEEKKWWKPFSPQT